jgi:hypothetical protein
MYQPYIVAEPDAAKAVAIIKANVAKDDEHVASVEAVSEAVVEAFHLQLGDFTRAMS